jgi:hypothetical protein
MNATIDNKYNVYNVDTNLIFETEGEADSSAVVSCLKFSNVLRKSKNMNVGSE